MGDLVVLGHIGVEGVLEIPDDGGRSVATEEYAREDDAFDGVFIEDGEGTGEVRQVWVLGSSPKEVWQPQNILVRLLIWQWTSSPMVAR